MAAMRTFLQTSLTAVLWFLLGVLFTWTCHIRQSDTYSMKPFLTNHTDASSCSAYQQLLDVQKNQTQSSEQNLANFLAKRIRILCLVVTSEKYHQTRAQRVKETWGKRCTKLVFLSDSDDLDLPAMKFTHFGDWFHLWPKVRGGFAWAHKHHFKRFDWFMKADDDTFVVMENLRALLADYNPNEPHYIGHEFAPPRSVPDRFNAGGCGYLLSREALNRLVTDAFSADPTVCENATAMAHEDREIGRCLENIGISTVDTRDYAGRQRFLPQATHQHLQVGFFGRAWYIWKHEATPLQEGEDCCSHWPIGFHNVTPVAMLELEYYLYRLRTFGLEPILLNGADTQLERRRQENYQEIVRENYKTNLKQ